MNQSASNWVAVVDGRKPDLPDGICPGEVRCESGNIYQFSDMHSALEAWTNIIVAYRLAPAPVCEHRFGNVWTDACVKCGLPLTAAVEAKPLAQGRWRPSTPYIWFTTTDVAEYWRERGYSLTGEWLDDQRARSEGMPDSSASAPDTSTAAHPTLAQEVIALRAENRAFIGKFSRVRGFGSRDE